MPLELAVVLGVVSYRDAKASRMPRIMRCDKEPKFASDLQGRGRVRSSLARSSNAACIPQALGLISPNEAQFNMVFCDLVRMFYGRRHRLLRRWNPHRKRSGGLIGQCFVQWNGRRGRRRRLGHYHYRFRRNGRNFSLRWFCRSQLHAQSLRLRWLRLRWSNPLLPPGICGRSSPTSPRCRLLFRARCGVVELYTHPP